jgi:hypothetical protein
MTRENNKHVTKTNDLKQSLIGGKTSKDIETPAKKTIKPYGITASTAKLAAARNKGGVARATAHHFLCCEQIQAQIDRKQSEEEQRRT